MKTGSIISYILAAIVIIISFLFILGSFSPNGSASWMIGHNWAAVRICPHICRCAFGVTGKGDRSVLYTRHRPAG